MEVIRPVLASQLEREVERSVRRLAETLDTGHSGHNSQPDQVESA
jgi:hypothetical protein